MQLYRTGLVKRYHTHTHMNVHGQNNAQHQWGCAAIIEDMCPTPTLNLFRAAIFHDTGEEYSGDLSYMFKRDHPEIASAHQRIEAESCSSIVGEFNLTTGELMWLKFADRLECLLHVNHHKPELLREPDWQKSICDIKELADELGVTNQYVELLYGFEIFKVLPAPLVDTDMLAEWENF